MLIKCACNNCSTHLEFESGHEGEIITCPSCMLETQLYAPPPTPVAQKPIRPNPQPPKSLPKPPAPKSVDHVVEQLRRKSSYPYMRSLIQAIYRAHIILALLCGAIGIWSVFTNAALKHESSVPAIVLLIVSICVALLFVVAGKVWKEASSVVLDIADCQIQSLKNRSEKP